MKGSCSLFLRDRILPWLLGVSESLDVGIFLTAGSPGPRAALLLSRARASFVGVRD